MGQAGTHSFAPVTAGRGGPHGRRGLLVSTSVTTSLCTGNLGPRGSEVIFTGGLTTSTGFKNVGAITVACDGSGMTPVEIMGTIISSAATMDCAVKAVAMDQRVRFRRVGEDSRRDSRNIFSSVQETDTGHGG